MSQELDFDLKQAVLMNGTFGPREIDQIRTAINEDRTKFAELRQATNELAASSDQHSPAGMVRLGVCYFMLGKYVDAIDTLRQGDGGPLAQFYLGRCHIAIDQPAESLDFFEAARKGGYDPDTCALSKSEALRSSGQCEEALEALDGLSGAIEQTAEYLTQRAATVASVGGNPSEVIALLERAVETNGSHAGALFGLAVENDRYGNDHEAYALYERATMQFPAHIGSLLNLGILCEDREDYERAVQCYRRILDSYPMHERAILFLKDSEASRSQCIDEEEQRRRDRQEQVFNVPVTDFELSVRARNCLERMNIRSLGDLCRHSEHDLLSSKNFGETSLTEIQQMLASKGLVLGQLAAERRPVEQYDIESLSPDEKALLERPVSELGLSVRARRCITNKNIATIGDLVRTMSDELLKCKNFGVTSLNEVRQKMAVFNLRLRGD